MKKLKKQSISLFVMLSSVTAMVGCSNFDATQFEANTRAEMNDIIEGTPGQAISISIVDNDKVYQYHEGKFKDGAEPNNKTVFEIASLTKTYTGLAVAKAIIDGKVELDADIRNYLKGSEYKNLSYDGAFITLRHLMTHSSGLPKDFAYTLDDIKNGTAFDKIKSYTRSDFFNDLDTVQLNSLPGEEWAYSNIGTDLIGYILESVYKKPFESIVSELILEKSGELDTQFRRTPLSIEDITFGMDGQGNPMPLSSVYGFADGGLSTTVESATRYMHHQLSDSPEVALSHTLIKGSSSDYGIAFFWHTNEHDSNEQRLSHSGRSMGSSSFMVILPKRKIGLFVVTNKSSNRTQKNLRALSEDVLDYLDAYNKAINSK